MKLRRLMNRHTPRWLRRQTEGTLFWVLTDVDPREQADLWMVAEEGFHGTVFEGRSIDREECELYTEGDHELPCLPSERWGDVDIICSMDRDTQARVDMLLHMGEVEALKALTAEVTARMREL